MGNVLRLPGFKALKPNRIVKARKLDVNAYDPQIAISVPIENGWNFRNIESLPAKWPKLTNVSYGATGWTAKNNIKTIVIQKPSDCIGICGVSTIPKRSDAASNFGHFVPFFMGDKSSSYTNNNGWLHHIRTSGYISSTNWVDIIDYNINLPGVNLKPAVKYLELLNEVDNVFVADQSWQLGLFRWAAVVPSEVSVLGFTWVLPSSSSGANAGPTYGVGVTDPNIYILYE